MSPHHRRGAGGRHRRRLLLRLLPNMRTAALARLAAAAVLALVTLGLMFGATSVSRGATAMYRTRLSKQAVLAGQCRPAPDLQEGLGPRIKAPLVDDVPSFVNFPEFTTQALAAMSVPGYRLKDWNLRKTVSNDLVEFAQKRLNMATYDMPRCAFICNSTLGCKAFNIYYQRSPTMAPTEGDGSRCPNPPSMTNIFCVLYSTAIKAKDVSWEGDRRGQFQMAIAGSNVFNKVKEPQQKPKTPAGELPRVTLFPGSVEVLMN